MDLYGISFKQYALTLGAGLLLLTATAFVGPRNAQAHLVCTLEKAWHKATDASDRVGRQARALNKTAHGLRRMVRVWGSGSV